MSRPGSLSDRGVNETLPFRIFLARRLAVVLLLTMALMWLSSDVPALAQEGEPDQPLTISDADYSAIVAGLEHTCALLTDGHVLCWGNTAHGRTIPPDDVFRSISAGGGHNCGVRQDGTVACWGWSDHGQTNSPTGEFISVGAGREHSCGLRANRSIQCWGRDSQSVIEPPSGAFNFLSVGVHHNCAIKTSGSLACWGLNFSGQATPPAGLFRFVSAGYTHSCGILLDGTLWCWGENDHGKATPPAGIFRSVSAGYGNTCGLRIDGAISCWGWNNVGQSFSPEGSFRSVSTRYGHTCAVRDDGAALCWGSNDLRKLDFPFPDPSRRIEIPAEPLVRGQAGDYWADVIIGKPDFSEIVPSEVTPFKLFNPGGVYVDRSVDPGFVYVWDSGNSRILGMDLAGCYGSESPCHADIVLGQPSLYDHAACNGDSGVQGYPHRAPATASTLCGIPDLSLSPWEAMSFVNMVVDPMRNLYMPDSFNNRVLFYERPFEEDSVADAVWGQSDFSGFNCNRGDHWNPTAKTLCFHSTSNSDRRPAYDGWPAGGVELDVDGNLWIADSGNNRVLRFPFDRTIGQPGDTADLVLGQPDFHHRDTGPGLQGLFAPGALRFGPNGRLYVADTYNNRVVVFDPPFSPGMSATETFGHSFRSPNGLEIDPALQGVWVNDIAGKMVSLWDWSGDRVLKVVGKADYRPENGGMQFSELPGAPMFHDAGGGIGFDHAGNLLVSVSSYTQDVLRFPYPIPDVDSRSGGRPDKRLFYPPGESNLTGTKGLRNGDGVAVFQDQLVVADARRLMFWNGLETLANGKAADGVIGDEAFHPVWPSCCGNIKADDAGRLWVNSFEGRAGFIDVYQLPLTHQAAPLETFWTRAKPLPVLGTNSALSIGSGGIVGIAPASGGKFLWLSDTDSNRVVRIRDPLTAPTVDVILGQLNSDGNRCNRRDPDKEPVPREEITPDMLCVPGYVALDRHGNLWVSDHSLEAQGNFRLLMFSRDLFPTDNTTVIFAPPATKNFAEHGNSALQLMVDYQLESSGTLIESYHRGPYASATFEPAFDSLNQMAVGYNSYIGGRFVGVYDDLLGESTQPSGYLNDLASMPLAAAFDDRDNLYIGDHNRGRVLVYWNPFNNPPAAASRPRQLANPAPLPDYTSNILQVSPEPPACILKNAPPPDQASLTLTVPDLPRAGEINVQVRRLTDRRLHTLVVDDHYVRIDQGNRVSISKIWSHLWREYEATWATVRLLHNGQPLTGWSKSFIVAAGAAECLAARLSPTATPGAQSPTPLPTATVTPTVKPAPASVGRPPATALAPVPTTTPSVLASPPDIVPTPNAETKPTPLPTAIASLPQIPIKPEVQTTVPAIAPVPESGRFPLPGISPIWSVIGVVGGLAVIAGITYYIWDVIRG